MIRISECEPARYGYKNWLEYPRETSIWQTNVYMGG
jgi:hypothetical protein